MLNSNNNVDLSKFIDEVFRPINTAESTFLTNPVDGFLESLVEEEMISKGLDPLNKEDVKKFWASKGVGNG